ncbi:MAG: pilus (MSHA type) biogenesis protein MshL, partial [Desulfobulbaceae bacterium]|nr:pilus (MSHA type) biogenesis protein MshL [Desulfobulbaceae bacterium]
KSMNISWASDVDASTLVDVDIRAEDDFFQALDHLLRQKDYFHEVQGNTIVVKYKETRKFHVAMPFLITKYTTSVGGDVLGGTGSTSNVTGNIQMTSDGNTFDIWKNIRKNLDQVLEIWEEPMSAAVSAPAGAATTAATAPVASAGTAAATKSGASTAAPTTTRNVKAGKGYYSIDEPIGLITVTAPRPLVEKISTYIDNLKSELFKQVSIEAKILEVTIDDVATRGIDWTQMLSGKGISFELFGNSGIIYQPGTSNRMVSKVSLTGNPFAVALDFLDTIGRTKVLANPRLSVMNGQPAMISVGDSVKYIDSVDVTTTETTVTTTVNTATVMSGLGMSVVATVMENDEIVLSLTPVTSKLEEPIDYVEFGNLGASVGLPKVRLREMNTMVRVKSGEVLVIGGLIDSLDDNDDTKVPLLGDIPGLGKLFSHGTKTTQKTEMVILLQPTIL